MKRYGMVLGVLGLLLLGLALTQGMMGGFGPGMMGYGPQYGPGMMGYGMMGGAWGGLLMLFFSVLVIAGITLLVIWAVRAASGHGGGGAGSMPPPSAGHDEAVAIARKRLASGEITREQYDEIVAALGG
jgi:uncharacterized membrane protein